MELCFKSYLSNRYLLNWKNLRTWTMQSHSTHIRLSTLECSWNILRISEQTMEKKEFPTYIQPQSGRHRHTTMLQCLPNTWQALSISNVAFKQAGRQAGRQPVPITPATNAYLKKCPGWQGMVGRTSKCCSWSFGIFLDFLDFFYFLLFFCSRLRLAQHYWLFLWFKWIVFKVFLPLFALPF